MGLQIASTYVIIVIRYSETSTDNMEDRYGAIAKNTIIRNVKGELDDCVIIWEEKLDKIENFLHILQTLHNNIQFAIETKETSIKFLDIHINMRDSNIASDIHPKLTDC